jgi:hypothetical protein
MFIIVLICLIVGLSGFYFSLKKQNTLSIFLSFTLCLFSSFLFSFYVDGRNANKINGFKNIAYNKMYDLENSNEQKVSESLKQFDTQLFNLSNRIQELEWQGTETGQEQMKIKAFNAKEANLCKRLPYTSDIGGDVYPTDPKYGDRLGYLGQLFTAVPCGEQRVQKIMGVDGENYIFGAEITLREAPSENLFKNLNTLGFVCNEKSDLKNCKDWRLVNSVKVNDILKLEPFSQEFSHIDCTNCG